MKTTLLNLTLALTTLAAPAQLVSDQHWSYELPQMSPEPLTFASIGNYLYAGGLFLNTAGVSGGQNFVRLNYTTESWEAVPGLSSGLNGRVDTIVEGSEGDLYVGGNFSNPGGTSARRIARFIPATGTWEALSDPNSNLTAANWSNGPADGRVLAITLSGNFVYAGGNFTLASIPTHERFILRYNLNTSSWGAVGTGTGAQVDALATLPNGDVIAATRNAAGLMLWDGTSWSTYAGGITGPGDSGEVDTEDATGAVRVIKRHPDGRIFIGGSFTTAGPLSARYVAAYNPATDTWSHLDGGFGPEYIQSNGLSFNADGVYDLVINNSGQVFAAGDFQSSLDGQNQRLNHIAMWDDSGEWKALGSGLGSTGSQIVNCLAVGPEQQIFAGGTFSRGWLPARSATTQIAVWDADEVLFPIPATEESPIIRIEEGRSILYLRTVIGGGDQYKVQDSATLPFPDLNDTSGRFSGGNIGVVRRDLGPAPAGRRFYRVFKF